MGGKVDLSGFFCVCYEAEVDRHPKSEPNLLILESNPDIYYYGHQLPEVKATPLEHHLFVLSDRSECYQDEVFRHLAMREKEWQIKLHIYPGQMKIGKDVYQTLRFRENELDYALKLVEHLKQVHNFQFVPDKKFKRQKAVIHYRKYIELEQLFDGVYKDVHSRRVYFINIPGEMKLEQFYQLVSHIKNSYNFSTFEPFYAYVVLKYYEVEYFFMFYAPNCEVERLPQFREAVNREYRRIVG